MNINSFLKACSDGNFDEIILSLKDSKVSPPWLLHITDLNRGWTCLQWAAWHSNVKCVKFLLTQTNINVGVKDKSGQTALHLSLQPRADNVNRDARGRIAYPREPSFEIIKMLLEVNNYEFAGCSKPQCATNIASSLMCHHFDVIKLLIGCESFLNFSKHILWHTAALYQRVDCMRYLLCRPEYNPKARDVLGLPPYFIYFQRIVRDTVVPMKEDIEFLFELMFITIESREDSVELYFMLIDCFRFRGTRQISQSHDIFTELVKLLLSNDDPKKQLVDKILCTELPSDYCLVLLILFDGIMKYIEKCKFGLTIKESYLRYLEHAKDFFFQELFTLYKTHESLFVEYITKVVEMKWTFNRLELCSLLPIFSSCLNSRSDKQKFFDFTKSLIFNQFGFILTAVPLLVPNWSVDIFYDFLLNIFMPLWKCVNAPIELMKLLRFEEGDCYYNFNETGNCIDDYKRLLERNSNQYEVVSLKNLSRMALRKHLFDNFTHDQALSKMYSSNVPPIIKRFICYNHSNFQF